MSQETTWKCDWCGTKTKTNDERPYPKDWVKVDPDMIVGRVSGKQHEGVKLFPKEMVVTDPVSTKCTHWEGELCAECCQAIVDAVKNAREARIAQRP